ncbi:MAG: hypothetical protein ABIQ18_10590 [Umezawaea sp.]
MDEDERFVLTEVCRGLEVMRAECAALPQRRRDAFEHIVEEAKARRPLSALVRAFLGGPTRSLGRALPGAGSGRAHEEVFGCPDGACDRIGRTEPAGPVPRCSLTGHLMKRE